MGSEVAFYPFSPGIPWTVEDGVLKKDISRKIWDVLVAGKEAYVLCPGYAVEAIMLPMFKKILKKNGVDVAGWIVPAYYSGFLERCSMKVLSKSRSNDIFSEHARLSEAGILYPSPVFMDREEKVYFNSCFNYGKIAEADGTEKDRNVEPFWKQFLENTCCRPCETVFGWFDNMVLKGMLKDAAARYGFDHERPYVLIDNNFVSYDTADGRTCITRPLLPHQVRSFGATLAYRKYQCIVLSSEVPPGCFSDNAVHVPPWYKMDFMQWLALLSLCSGIYSSDPNVYLPAAMIGCGSVFAGGNFDFGWELSDVPAHLFRGNGGKRRVQMDEFGMEDIVDCLVEKTWKNI